MCIAVLEELEFCLEKEYNKFIIKVVKDFGSEFKAINNYLLERDYCFTLDIPEDKESVRVAINSDDTEAYRSIKPYFTIHVGLNTREEIFKRVHEIYVEDVPKEEKTEGLSEIRVVANFYYYKIAEFEEVVSNSVYTKDGTNIVEFITRNIVKECYEFDIPNAVGNRKVCDKVKYYLGKRHLQYELSKAKNNTDLHVKILNKYICKIDVDDAYKIVDAVLSKIPESAKTQGVNNILDFIEKTL